MDKKLSRVLVQRKINIQMNKELHRLANDEARWERIDHKLSKKYKSIPLHQERLCKFKQSNKDVIYVVGDIHYRGDEDNDLVIKTFSDIKKDIEERGYKNVSLWLTGDNVDGEIHEEQQRTNDPVVDAAIKISDLLVSCINSIPQIKEVKLVYGNHEEVRLWGTKNSDNNVGKFIGHAICIGLNIPVEHGEELYFNYKGKKILLLHGHQGYAKSKAKIIEHCAVSYGELPEMIVIGHFHTSKANQFSKDRWLITAPAVKDWESRWDKANGFCGLGQFVKLKLNKKTPQITTMDVGGTTC